MNNSIYQIAMKKEYAAAIIEDLKLLDAIEILEQPIPAWQQEESINVWRLIVQTHLLALKKKLFLPA